tara:strand:- start:212 stop:1063 length:852 start_codon:yes stop_codon:yes gene_type:complete
MPKKNLTIRNYRGRFGNNLQQLATGIIYSELNNANFYSKKHPQFKKIFLINDSLFNSLKFFKKRFDFFNLNKENKLEKYNQQLISQNFLKEKFYLENINRVCKNIIAEKIKFLKNIDIDEDTLIIHIRSGEIFNGKDKYLDYVQNPIAYYEILIEKYPKILIVSENKENPVIDYLLKNKKVKFQSSTAENDFNTLVSATNLATSGVGTFATAAALVSKKLKNFYCTDIFLDNHLNPSMLDDQFVKINIYKVKNYIPIGSWIANKQNIERMLDRNINIIEPNEF